MAVKKKRRPQADSIGVRVYNVGLGDCFLLNFRTADGKKKVDHRILIDFGSTGRNKIDGPTMTQVAEQIVEDCGGKYSEIDALIVTHRHQDHMSGFGGKAGKILMSQLRPKMIVQPWTEDPDAEDPTVGAGEAAKAAANQLHALRDAQTINDSILNEILERRENGKSRLTDDEAVFYCQKNLPFDSHGQPLKTLKKVKNSADDLLDGLNVEAMTNADAILNLQNWKWKSGGKNKHPSRTFLQKDDPLELSIPGLSVTTLGPVGPKQWETLKKHGSSEELWQKLQALRSHDLPTKEDSRYIAFNAKTNGVYGVPSLFDETMQVPDGDFRKDSVRWLTENLDHLRGEQLLGFVRVLDKHINNTSLVLLFEFGGFRMLFPGDAEVASWRAIVSDPTVASKLKGIDLYKVGHHGSNNATPIESLWEKLVANRNDDQPLHCVLSTLTTKFDGSIPNVTLLKTMLGSDKFQLISTAYPHGSPRSKHADNWKAFEKGKGSKKVVMSYFREFDLS